MFASLLGLSLTAALTASNPVLAAEPVEWLGGGSWISATYTGPTGRRGCDVSTWIDYTLSNWSYEKDTGIVWTVDDWATVNQADGWYEGAAGDGLEQWGVNIQPAQLFKLNPTWPAEVVTFEYAIYYTVGGTTWWDSNGGANYQIVMTPDGC